MVERLNRAALVLGLGALASGLFALPDAVQYRLVRLAGAGLVVLLVLGAVTVVAARLGLRRLVAACGAGFVAAALVQLVQLGHGTNWLRGDGSTVSLFLGFGVGLLMLGLTPVPGADVIRTTEGVDRAS